MREIKDYFCNMTKKKAVLVAAFVLVLLLGISLIVFGIYYGAKSRAELEEQEHMAEEVVMEIMTETKPEPEAPEPVIQNKKVAFLWESIEQDLQISIVDEAGKLVVGHRFKIAVFPEQEENKSVEYVDEDADGIIYISEIKAGKYKVRLHEIEHMEIVENLISVEVRDKIVYQKVEVIGEIKKETEINAAQEDTARRDVVEEDKLEPPTTPNKVETKPPTTTLKPSEKPSTEADVFPPGTIHEVVVEKKDISLTNFPKATLSETWKEEVIQTTRIRIPETVILYSAGNIDSISKTITVTKEETLGTEGEAQEEVQEESAYIQSSEWKCEEQDIVEFVSNEDGSVTLTAHKSGTILMGLLITYLDDDGVEWVKEMQMSVVVSDMADDKTQLLDLQGNGLFLDKEAKTIATLKDYTAQDMFYGTPKYEGWHTIDGKTYYYSAEYKPVTGKQTIDGKKYEFSKEGHLLQIVETKGIDVSKWQANINWSAVKNAGIEFAIIRVGYRGSATGVLVEDPYFQKNMEGATKAGLKVGVYFFTQAITEAEAVKEASMAIELVKGYRLDYPIFIDTEWADGRADNLSRDKRTKIVDAFCKTVKNAGYQAGIYASKSWYNNQLHAKMLEQYYIWVAQYNTECNYAGKYDMWQYTSKGAVSGINGRVDMNIAYTKK